MKIFKIIRFNSLLISVFFLIVNTPVFSSQESRHNLLLSGSTQFGFTIDCYDHDTNENSVYGKNRTVIKADYKNFTLSGISDYQYFGEKDEIEDYSFDIYEMYFKYSINSFDITLGKCIKRWGKADQISPVDTLNPENMTELILMPYEDRKLPVWMADITYRNNDYFIEGVFIPFFEPDRFHYFGTDWAIFSHLKKDINNSPIPFFLKYYFNSISVNETLPDDGTDSFEYALRVGATIDRFDFGLTYHYAVEDQPFFSNFPVKNLSVSSLDPDQDLTSNAGNLILTNENIETTYLRTHIFGVEFETTFLDFGVRGEAAINDQKSFLTGSLTSVRRPVVFWILGVDYLSPDEWYFNFQLGHQHIFDFEPSILYFDDNNYSLTGVVKKDLISDWLNASVQFTAMLNDSSCYISPRLKYTYIRNLEVILGINFFEGDEDSLLGRYDEYDEFYVTLKYYF